jgi:LmbE family N-acetylglucosaminyl deacetylase
VKKILLIFFLSSQCFTFCRAQKVLIVTAHPDDEAVCAVTAYKITHELKGLVDLVVITNGEGGYKYSTLADDYYHLELTDEKTGRENLPRIRKQEMMNAGKIIGLHNIFFLDQTDAHYTLNERDPLDTSWDVALVKNQLKQIMLKGKYDFVFSLLPTPGTHGHHKAATILALEVVNGLPENQRPVILAGSTMNKTDSVKNDFVQLNDYQLTAINKEAPDFLVDRTARFGYKQSLDYKIILNWEIAEHKSQGTTQMTYSQGDIEKFSYFSMNNRAGIEKTRSLFDRLKNVPYPSKTY